MPERIDVAIVGAGPFGLSTGAFLRGVHARVFGPVLETWSEVMPPEMILRSSWEDATIASPGEVGSTDRWIEATGEEKPARVSLQTFLRYGEWFREQLVREHDPSRVELVARENGGYRVGTSSGDEVRARHVVVAVGTLPFAYAPAPFAHAVDGDRVRFAFQRGAAGAGAQPGERIVIVGAGQSALESAASAARAGAAVEIVVRSHVHWFADREPERERGPLGRMLYDLAYPVVGFGPPPLNRIVLAPDLFASLPLRLRNALNGRLLRAGGAPWLRDEVESLVAITEGRVVVSLERTGDELRLGLDDGSVREADRVLLATGFRFDVARLDFFAPELRGRIRIRHGWPVIDRNLRSVTEPGISFAGYPAEGTFGPATRFVRGTRLAGPRIAAALGLAPALS